MDKINFENLPSTNTPINANNLNLLQTNVENALTTLENGIDDKISYSTSEKQIGYWINDKPLYRKVVDFGSLPNTATTKSVPHGISDIGIVAKIEGYATYTSSGNQIWYPMPLQYAGNAYTNNVQFYIDKTNIIVQTNSDRSAYSSYVIIEYTKTTD